MAPRPSRKQLVGIQRSMAAALLQGKRYPAYPFILRALKRFARLRKRSAITRAAKRTRSGLWVQGRIRGRRYRLWIAARGHTVRFDKRSGFFRTSPCPRVSKSPLLDIQSDARGPWVESYQSTPLHLGVATSAFAIACRGSPLLTWRVLKTIERGCRRCQKLIKAERA
jgi:hypothetical protein